MSNFVLQKIESNGTIDIHKLNSKNFPEGRVLTKDDYVIICGDFGFVWDGGKEDKWWLNWLAAKPWTTLFVDGNHENHDILEQWDVTNWHGGKVHKLNESVIHLMRGQVYEIDGKKWFTFGGAKSQDQAIRVEGKDWWPGYSKFFVERGFDFWIRGTKKLIRGTKFRFFVSWNEKSRPFSLQRVKVLKSYEPPRT